MTNFNDKIQKVREYLNNLGRNKMALDATKLKLGKKPPRYDARTLQLSKYVDALPAPPASCDWTKGVTQFGMMLNGPNDFNGGVPSDGLGDCTCAMMGHGVQVARLNSPSGLVTPPDGAILGLYETACGYVPGNPSTDQGGVIIDVLNYARQNAPWLKRKRWQGPGHKHPWQLLAYADPSVNDLTHVQQAVATFGTVGIGLELPLTAQSQIGTLWDVVGNPNTNPNSAPGSWGGHAIVVVGYKTVNGELQFLAITWGQLQWMTAKFWTTYVDEAHALLYSAWVQQFGAQYPTMLTQLEADLKLVTN